jgi:hypothetical protein
VESRPGQWGGGHEYENLRLLCGEILLVVSDVRFTLLHLHVRSPAQGLTLRNKTIIFNTHAEPHPDLDPPFGRVLLVRG